MRNRENWTCHPGRIRKQSLGITLFLHCAGLLALTVNPWKKANPSLMQVFDIQLVSIPLSIPSVPEAAGKPEEIPSKRETPGRQGNQSSAGPARRAEPSPGKAGETDSFASASFRERLASRIRTSGQPASRKDPVEREPVGIKRIERPIPELNLPDTGGGIPEWYLSLVQSRIRENWILPAMPGRRSATVSFRIYSTGRIANVSLELASGNAGLDRSVMDALKSAGGLPVFPAGIRQPHLDIIMEFNTEG